MITLYRKYFFPIIAIALGLVFLIAAVMSEQNLAVRLGAVAILAAGIVALVSVAVQMSRVASVVLFAVLAIASGGLSAMDYNSIKSEIDIRDEWEVREKHIVQRLKDIRAAQQAYKFQYGRYTPDFDTLTNFLINDSMTVIEAVGTVPDTLTEAEAVEMGLVRRDTFFQSPLESNYMAEILREREFQFHLDSLRYVPFQGTSEFELEAGTIERGKVTVQAFMVRDSDPFIKGEVRQVGSMTEPSLSGNWE